MQGAIQFALTDCFKLIFFMVLVCNPFNLSADPESSAIISAADSNISGHKLHREEMKRSGFTASGAIMRGNLMHDEKRDEFFGGQVTAGYQYNRLRIQLGVGLQAYWKSGTYIPFFTGIKWDFLLRKFTPFINFEAGKIWKDQEGYFFNPELGLKLVFKRPWGMILSIGYREMRFKKEVPYYIEFYKSRDKELKNMLLKIGVSF